MEETVQREPILITVDETSIPESPVPSDAEYDEEELARFIAALARLEDIDIDIDRINT